MTPALALLLAALQPAAAADSAVVCRKQFAAVVIGAVVLIETRDVCEPVIVFRRVAS